MIVKAFNHQWFRFIDLDADKEGDYPLRYFNYMRDVGDVISLNPNVV